MGRKATTKNAARGKKASTAQESSGKKAPPGQAPRPPLAVSEWVYTLIKCKSPEALAAMAEGANRAHPVWKEEHQSLYNKFEKKVTRNSGWECYSYARFYAALSSIFIFDAPSCIVEHAQKHLTGAPTPAGVDASGNPCYERTGSPSYTNIYYCY